MSDATSVDGDCSPYCEHVKPHTSARSGSATHRAVSNAVLHRMVYTPWDRATFLKHSPMAWLQGESNRTLFAFLATVPANASVDEVHRRALEHSPEMVATVVRVLNPPDADLQTRTTLNLWSFLRYIVNRRKERQATHAARERYWRRKAVEQAVQGQLQQGATRCAVTAPEQHAQR